MARLVSKIRTSLLGGPKLFPGRPAFVPDEMVDKLLAAGNGHGRDLVSAKILTVELDRLDTSTRMGRIRDLVAKTLESERLARVLPEDEIEEARTLLSARIAELEPIWAEQRREIEAAAQLEAQAHAEPDVDDDGAADDGAADDDRGDSTVKTATLDGLTIAQATPLIDACEDVAMLKLWIETDPRQGIHRLCEERIALLEGGQSGG